MKKEYPTTLGRMARLTQNDLYDCGACAST